MFDETIDAVEVATAWFNTSVSSLNILAEKETSIMSKIEILDADNDFYI